jgi:hypothetical protein
VVKRWRLDGLYHDAQARKERGTQPRRRKLPPLKVVMCPDCGVYPKYAPHICSKALANEQGTPARITEGLEDLLVRNPAPDGSPSREPTGIYRIVEQKDK